MKEEGGGQIDSPEETTLKNSSLIRVEKFLLFLKKLFFLYFRKLNFLVPKLKISLFFIFKKICLIFQKMELFSPKLKKFLIFLLNFRRELSKLKIKKIHFFSYVSRGNSELEK